MHITGIDEKDCFAIGFEFPSAAQVLAKASIYESECVRIMVVRTEPSALRFDIAPEDIVGWGNASLHCD